MKYLKDNGPEADKELPPRVIPVVNVMGVRVGAEQLVIRTQGRVEPVRRTQAASEVMGRVVMVSPKFEVGGQFSHDEIMLEVDECRLCFSTRCRTIFSSGCQVITRPRAGAR